MSMAVGVDIAEVGRFRTLLKTKDRGQRFIDKIFSAAEQAYCFSYKDPAPHLAGTFAAKEAVQKASGDFTTSPRALEIRRTKSGKPELWRNKRRLTRSSVSISHTGDIACAVAIYRI